MCQKPSLGGNGNNLVNRSRGFPINVIPTNVEESP